jgi:hypothetical protein
MVQYLTKKQLARKYGVSVRSINHFMRCGLPHYRLGDSPKNLRFREDEADQWAGHFRVDEDQVDRIVNEILG